MSASRKLLKGELAPHLQAILRRGIIAAIIAMLGIAAFAILFAIGAPWVLMVIATSLFVGGAVYLSGIAYGIINDIIGCLKNLPYFLLGHQPDQRAVVESNKPGVVAVAWGILATADLSLIAAGLFTVATLIAGFFVPVATFLLPALLILIPLVAVVGHLYSKHKEKERLENEKQYTGIVWTRTTWGKKTVNQIEHDFDRAKKYGLDPYHRERLDVMCTSQEEKNAWLGNSDRNVFGYIGMPAVGAISLVGIVTVTAVSPLLPAVLFGGLVATVVPLVAVGILAVAIAAAITYMAVNYRKQDDNKYKLDFGHEAPAAEEVSTTMNKDLHTTLNAVPTREGVENKTLIVEDEVENESAKTDAPRQAVIQQDAPSLRLGGY